MLADLRAAAAAAGHPEWGHGGPHDAGHYNSRSWDTGFFKSQGGRWQSDYGHFFQSWYRWGGGWLCSCSLLPKVCMHVWHEQMLAAESMCGAVSESLKPE